MPASAHFFIGLPIENIQKSHFRHSEMSKFPRRGPKTFSCRCGAQTFLGLNCDPVIFGAGSAPADYEIRRSIDRFSEISAMPQVLAAIDGTYIPIRAPEDDHDDFICRKGYHSMILQAIVGADTEIYDASTGFPGSMHDARVLQS